MITTLSNNKNRLFDRYTPLNVNCIYIENKINWTWWSTKIGWAQPAITPRSLKTFRGLKKYCNLIFKYIFKTYFSHRSMIMITITFFLKYYKILLQGKYLCMLITNTNWIKNHEHSDATVISPISPLTFIDYLACKLISNYGFNT